MKEILKRWIDDAADTTERIRGDVAHLREIGRQATYAARVATGAAKQKFERLAEQVAEKIVAFEQATGTDGRKRSRS